LKFSWVTLALGLLRSLGGAPANALDLRDSIGVIDTSSNEAIGEIFLNVNDGPQAIATVHLEAGDYGYVTGSSAGTVTAINLETNQVVGAPIRVGAVPLGISIAETALGTFAYVANSSSGTVSVIDTATNQVVGLPIPVGAHPTALAAIPDGGFVYVTLANAVLVIQTIDNTVVGAPIGVGSTPSGIAMTPAGTPPRAYVTNYDSNSVSVIDVDPGSKTYNQVIATLAVGSHPIGIAITPDGGHAFIANNGSSDGTDAVSLIDIDPESPDYHTVINISHPWFSCYPESVAVGQTPNGVRAYITVTAYDEAAIVMDEFGDVLTGIDASLPDGIALKPDGTRAYVTMRQGLDRTCSGGG
jgi:YVTN family beta-propeller protein